MTDPTEALRTQLVRQVAHWTLATSSLKNLDDLASPSAWSALERYLGVTLRKQFMAVVDRVLHQAEALRASLDAARSMAELEAVQRQLLVFRHQYLRAETTLDFYADAINTRTSPTVGGLLRACDILAHRSMAAVLDQFGKPTPVVLTYLDKGLGASILRAGLRLWDGASESQAAAVKMVRHNMPGPSLIHEAGHQVGYILSWNQALAEILATALTTAPPGIAETWAGWSSEIAADAFAFVHTGYAAVAGLHNVVAGEEPSIFRFIPGDPHPISYLRVLLGTAMCRHAYGAGPWDDLEHAWVEQHPLERAADTETLLRASVPLLPRIAALTLSAPLKAFQGRTLSSLVDPERVRPDVLDALEHKLGRALYTSMHWIWTEALRILALAGLRAATRPERALDVLKQQQEWMLRLGGVLQAA